MSEHTKYASAQASKSRGSSSEYSAVAVGGALVFGAVVGLAGVSLVRHPTSPLSGSSSGLGLTSTRHVKKNVDFDTNVYDFNHCLQGDFTPPDKAFASWSSDGSAARKLDAMKQEELLNPIGVTTDESGESVSRFYHSWSNESFCSTTLHHMCSSPLQIILWCTSASGGGASGEEKQEKKKKALFPTNPHPTCGRKKNKKKWEKEEKIWQKKAKTVHSARPTRPFFLLLFTN